MSFSRYRRSFGGARTSQPIADKPRAGCGGAVKPKFSHSRARCLLSTNRKSRTPAGALARAEEFARANGGGRQCAQIFAVGYIFMTREREFLWEEERLIVRGVCGWR